MFDYCRDDAVKCGKFGQFAQTCFRELAGVMSNTSDMCSWAEELGCAQPCGENSVYSGCADSCQSVRTCSNRTPDCPGTSQFLSMCVCEPGFVLENGKCIPEAECGCVIPADTPGPSGAYVPVGYNYENCDFTCTCTDGGYNCIPHDETFCTVECGCVPNVDGLAQGCKRIFKCPFLEKRNLALPFFSFSFDAM